MSETALWDMDDGKDFDEVGAETERMAKLFFEGQDDQAEEVASKETEGRDSYSAGDMLADVPVGEVPNLRRFCDD